MALANTTKLEAVNTMLHTISEQPVNSLSGKKAPIIENANETKAKIIEFFKMNLMRSFNINFDFLE